MHTALHDELRALESAEDFLGHFAIPYDPDVVGVHRLHILQRFHDYLNAATFPQGDLQVQRDHGRALLLRAYTDFVHSDARTEQVFAVFRRSPPGVTRIPLEQAFVHRGPGHGDA
ncbi:nitrogenase-stabilizing/protective protein [Ectothiorhodospira mobilis]|uniref:Nitrogenase-stabilizing/protective protein NifW n=1 Tax=Ectothiorhodospira mobilis TaxID=195064 RepID=A0A1I4QG23_ECTMO|nr:nitrogenase-stabilizing/protective protein NifW [Ectothiorhodospira mobilis]SFM38563.1 nitrogenase-stabilizing/protective protein [Ectothiorhodospira mobilis]